MGYCPHFAFCELCRQTAMCVLPVKNDYKLIIPEAIKAATHDHRAENHWAADFFSKCLRFEPDQSATARDLYSAYTTYCQGYRIAPLPQTKVMPRIADSVGSPCRRVYGRRTGSKWRQHYNRANFLYTPCTLTLRSTSLHSMWPYLKQKQTLSCQRASVSRRANINHVFPASAAG